MNIINKLTLRMMLKNKIRTLVTIVGIALSFTMFTAVMISISSLWDYEADYIASTKGFWHIEINNASDEILDFAKNYPETDSVLAIQRVGYIEAQTNDYERPYIFIGGVNGEITDMFFEEVVEGRRPENSSEIMLPVQLAQGGGHEYKIGDVIEAPLGLRETAEGTGSYIFESIYRWDYLDEVFAETGKVARYTVVGFFNDQFGITPYRSAGYTGITVADEKSEYGYDMYIKFTGVSQEKLGDFFITLENSGIDAADAVYSLNNQYLMYTGTLTEYDIYNVVITFVIILVIIIMTASVMLIFNSFSISLSERTKQFGLLKSIGATSKQLFRSVIFESLLLSIIAAPLGIGAAALGMSITFSTVSDMLGDLFRQTKYAVLDIEVSLIPVLIGVGIGIFSVLISAFIPALRAVRLSPIEAIRQSKDVKMNSRKLKTSRIMQKLFGMEGTLASKNFKRSRKKYRPVVISLFVSIVLFVSVTSFTSLFSTYVSLQANTTDYDVQATYYFNADEEIDTNALVELYSELKSVDAVTEGALHINVLGMGIPAEYANEKYRDNSNLIYDYGIGEIISCDAIYIDDANFMEYAKSQGVDVGIFEDATEQIGILYDNVAYFEDNKWGVADDVVNDDNFTAQYRQIKYFPDKAFLETQIDENGEVKYLFSTHKTISEDGYEVFTNDETELLSEDEATELITFKVAAAGSETPFGCDLQVGSRMNRVTVFFPMSMLEQNVTGHSSAEAVRMPFSSSDHTVTAAQMQEVIKNRGLEDSFVVYDAADNEEGMRQVIMVVQIFTTGFVVLISLISVSNVFNTISTNILLRKREFGILKSVGMERKGFSKMMRYECMLYGVKSTVTGVPVSIIMSYIIYYFTIETDRTVIGYVFPWQSLLVVVASVCIVVAITMLYSIRKINKGDPIEAIRDENI